MNEVMSETTKEPMSEAAFEEMLRAIIEDVDGDFAPGEGIQSVDTFEGAGLLTRNQGVVVKMEDGAEFQVSIVRSK